MKQWHDDISYMRAQSDDLDAEPAPVKHGIELRWKRGRKLRLASYAVWVNGVQLVDHATTRGYDSDTLQRMVDIEKAHYPGIGVI